MNSPLLERALRKRLRTSVRIKVVDLGHEGGKIEYEGVKHERPATIYWDPCQYDLVELVIHELCHPWLEEELQPLGAMEEQAIEGIAAAHTKYVRESSQRNCWWRREIKKRLDRRSLRRWLAA